MKLSDDGSFQFYSRISLEGVEGFEMGVLTKEFEDKTSGLQLLTAIVFLEGGFNQEGTWRIISDLTLPTPQFNIPNTEIEIGAPSGERDNFKELNGKGLVIG